MRERAEVMSQSYISNTEAVLKVKDEQLESYRLCWACHRLFDLHTMTFLLIFIDSATFCDSLFSSFIQQICSEGISYSWNYSEKWTQSDKQGSQAL